MKWVLMVLLAGCHGQASDGPAQVKYDRDVCKACGMVISDRQFVAEVRSPAGAVSKFDDVGCAARWLSTQVFAEDPTVKLWVATLDDEQWADARSVGYLSGKRSPMGYGYGATRDGGVSFDVMRQQLKKGGTP